MIRHNLFLASLALLLASPCYGVTGSETTADEQLTEEDFDLDEDDLDVADDQVTDEDLNDDTEITDSPLATEQEAEESLTVEPKDDGQELNQAAEEYLAKTSVKDAEIAAAGPAPRQEPVAVQIPNEAPVALVAETDTNAVRPATETATISHALNVKPVEVKNTAFVKKLQQALIAQGATIEADGHMGAATQAALLDFQKKSGLAADGVAGPATLTKLGVAR